MTQKQTLMRVENLRKTFPLKSKGLFTRRSLTAIDDLSFEIARGETLALVGESGCGKSTTGRVLLRLLQPTSGSIVFDGARLEDLSNEQMRQLRRRMQIVFQDPSSSLNPRMRVRDVIAEPIINFGVVKGSRAVDRRVVELLDRVGLNPDALYRYPHEFSGGQRQRIGIARALAPGCEFIVFDEAVSALDVSVKAQIINLLVRLQQDLNLTTLFISHDLAIVEYLADRVAVMYLGAVVEIGERKSIFGTPKHPYTQALLAAIPVPDPAVSKERSQLEGDLPDPSSPPSGCRFRTRCPYAFDRCVTDAPAMRSLGNDHQAACHLAS
ncbi:ABC transporter ATP-binding protein [Mesorhizobium sp.]|uniref:ABC transporter ATP-binding protein n=1 Tax=Mesorhizobium sp. TaxID=1871066 RepID=UPI000FE9EED6|nr:ABC transporter ATP-binding protein [Mesorhizobium sp.]RWJ05714.1 MAG: ABC transporter ATP-binding protein [Mesorhizobium sp.]